MDVLRDLCVAAARAQGSLMVMAERREIPPSAAEHLRATAKEVEAALSNAGKIEPL
jgi:hypothetical protein